MKIVYRLKTAVISMIVSMCALAAAVGPAQAQAQTPTGQDATQSAVSQSNTPPATQLTHDSAKKSRQSDYTGGVNTGREIQFNTPGCVGPISFCNLYFGS